jgi:hypothetical protein
MRKRIVVLVAMMVMMLSLAAPAALALSCDNVSRAAPKGEVSGPIIKGHWVWLPSIGVPEDAWGYFPPGTFGTNGNFTDRQDGFAAWKQRAVRQQHEPGGHSAPAREWRARRPDGLPGRSRGVSTLLQQWAGVHSSSGPSFVALFTQVSGSGILRTPCPGSCTTEVARGAVPPQSPVPLPNSKPCILWCWIKMQDPGSSRIPCSLATMAPGTRGTRSCARGANH